MECRRAVVVLASIGLVGCGFHRAELLPSGDGNTITEDEVVASRATTAFEVIQKLRGNFLSNRGATSFYDTSSPYPTVYIDGMRYGDIVILRSIPAEVVSTIRLYRAWEATTHYGTGNMGGVIAITTRQGGDQAAAYRH
ncbi:MAG: TonB-dependent receptor plug domain-containing protein [Gemmatimonadaceae bacterium]|nr:TonB-dependent receptor plug domain-containing protein [Gemmatimonadaceae bacterium]NUQ92815.1 TonB-dependent receptor plug domain-containing protein [Gemmatimonadaceae bacterium]NUR21216.1 TonB-dependent receptor plug domain-containing protein [Gemmatimonadaceae bacterium]NUS96568.1 TonB-dependent receptor plug domain-containing protein [Gemmatimonadaceae bacterium]